MYPTWGNVASKIPDSERGGALWQEQPLDYSRSRHEARPITAIQGQSGVISSVQRRLSLRFTYQRANLEVKTIPELPSNCCFRHGVLRQEHAAYWYITKSTGVSP